MVFRERQRDDGTTQSHASRHCLSSQLSPAAARELRQQNPSTMRTIRATLSHLLFAMGGLMMAAPFSVPHLMDSRLCCAWSANCCAVSFQAPIRPPQAMEEE
jgi:hypothetical protein